MKIKKYLFLTLAFALLSGVFASLPTNICHAADDSDISVCADIIEWVYNIEGTHVYRRLYNYSTASWIGDWIYVGEYNPS